MTPGYYPGICVSITEGEQKSETNHILHMYVKMIMKNSDALISKEG